MKQPSRHNKSIDQVEFDRYSSIDPTRQSRNQTYDGLPVRREVQTDGQDVRRTR